MEIIIIVMKIIIVIIKKIRGNIGEIKTLKKLRKNYIDKSPDEDAIFYENFEDIVTKEKRD